MGIFNFIEKKNKSKSISEKANILQNRNIEPATKKVSQKTLKKDLTNFLKGGIMNKSPRERNESFSKAKRRRLHLEN